MRKLTSLIATFILCTMLIVPASANSDNSSVLVEMSHVEAAALIDKEMDNWTGRDLGAWLVEHSYKYRGGHGFITMFYDPAFIVKIAKTPTIQDENGFGCARVIASVYLPSDGEKQTNGIAVKICVKDDVVVLDIADTLKRGESF